MCGCQDVEQGTLMCGCQDADHDTLMCVVVRM